MITVVFDNFESYEYKTIEDTRDAILKALAEGILVEGIYQTEDGKKTHSLVYTAHLFYAVIAVLGRSVV